MTQVSESPYQTEKHLHYHETNDLDEYLQENEQELINNDTNALPNDLARFSTESLHSFSFVANDSSSYENILRRSFDFMKNKLKGWRLPVVQNALFSPVVSTFQSADIVLPSESICDINELGSSRKFKGAFDIPSLYTSMNTSTLHSPTRFTPQSQAIITTNSLSNILCANDIACLIFGYSRTELSSIRALDLIASPFREKQERSLASRPQNDDDNCEVVLACGKVIPIQRKNEETSAASLWLKVKKDESGESVFIWIFEEIVETMMTAEIDERALYDYSSQEIIGMCITTLIPAFETVGSSYDDNTNDDMDIDKPVKLNSSLDIEKINKTKFYGSRSKNDGNFPIIGKISLQSVQEETEDDENTCTLYRLKIISIPTIAGVITAHKTGVIQSCNSDFVKYLFGVGAHELIGKRYIESLLPQFPRLVEYLTSERVLVEGILITEHAFRRAASFISKMYTPGKEFHVSGQGPSGIIAVHRDGTRFDVDIQMRVVESPDEPLHVLWITYDRNVNFVKDQSLEVNSSVPMPIAYEKKQEEYNNHVHEVSKPSRQLDRNEQDEEEKFPLSKFIAAGGKPPPLKRLSTDNRKITRPPSISSAPESFDPMLYSAITLTKSINDFIIVDNLGQGAYGQVNLAYNKNDPEKKRVVLKFVVKSKILVDCWTRDKSLGTVPLEIHILHTLRRLPHPNIVQMVDYFEDDEYYYIEMGLHGEGMDLFDYIELNNTMSEAEVKSIFRQVSRAIQHLHHNKIVHRDIKDENVILDENGNVQLIDFGSSAYLKEKTKYDTFCGTIDYAAPEVLTGKKYDGPPQDIWALGILLYTLIYRENPFYNIDEIIARDLRIPYILSEGSIDLIKCMLDRDVEKRPSIDDVLNHPWLRED
ncbi:15943_t:CDS:2 [Funneliformis geosporum]|uniref:non-specific serine/threonine protein kinase n=1 Tax=Funneliformis geosporum TaxID=1117311 RepID=A0A9W4SCS6_9GLOM|nr:18976_t:CDS:2 [Funneliformis geosporum]CAI2169819.1 15943_t:CDS:2 [Funneliformis geosporum]